MRFSHIILIVVAAVLAFLLAHWRLHSFDKKYNEFTQERGLTGKSVPDTILFVIFKKDTTFVIKIR